MEEQQRNRTVTIIIMILMIIMIADLDQSGRGQRCRRSHDEPQRLRLLRVDVDQHLPPAARRLLQETRLDSETHLDLYKSLSLSVNWTQLLIQTSALMLQFYVSCRFGATCW